jgi:hypothetical protein
MSSSAADLAFTDIDAAGDCEYNSNNGIYDIGMEQQSWTMYLFPVLIPGGIFQYFLSFMTSSLSWMTPVTSVLQGASTCMALIAVKCLDPIIVYVGVSSVFYVV